MTMTMIIMRLLYVIVVNTLHWDTELSYLDHRASDY